MPISTYYQELRNKIKMTLSLPQVSLRLYETIKMKFCTNIQETGISGVFLLVQMNLAKPLLKL